MCRTGARSVAVVVDAEVGVAGVAAVVIRAAVDSVAAVAGAGAGAGAVATVVGGGAGAIVAEVVVEGTCEG